MMDSSTRLRHCEAEDAAGRCQEARLPPPPACDVILRRNFHTTRVLHFSARDVRFVLS